MRRKKRKKRNNPDLLVWRVRDYCVYFRNGVKNTGLEELFKLQTAPLNVSDFSTETKLFHVVGYFFHFVSCKAFTVQKKQQGQKPAAANDNVHSVWWASRDVLLLWV